MLGGWGVAWGAPTPLPEVCWVKWGGRFSLRITGLGVYGPSLVPPTGLSLLPSREVSQSF